MEVQDIKTPPFLLSLESMSKAKSFLLITSTILYIDCVLAIAFRKNIKTFSWNVFSVSENIFYLTVIIFIYCALLAFILPALNHITITIVNCLKYKFGKYKETTVRYNCQSDVSLLAAKHYAEAENNYVLYKKCEKIETTNEHSAELSKFAFCVIALALFNCLALGDGASKTITQSLWGLGEVIEELTYNAVKNSVWSDFICFFTKRIFMASSMLVLLYFPIVWWINTLKDDIEYIFNPTLAAIINKEAIEKKRNRERQAWTD